jgi:glycosyltransferase involved in cell wall biosynthesis
VVIPVYNRAELLIDALNSVADQSHLPERVIVVDDGSNDNVAQHIADWLESRRPVIRPELIRQENSGVAAARNKGLEAAANADWIAFLDSDDRWPDNFLSRAIEALSADPGSVAAICDRRTVNRTTGEEELTDTRKFVVDPTFWCVSRGSAFLSGTVFRAESIRQIGGFRAELRSGQDLELYLTLESRGKFLHVPGKPSLYRLGYGDVGNLHQLYSNSQYRFALIAENYLAQEKNVLLRNETRYRLAMQRRWWHAGNQHLRAGRDRLAIESFEAVFRWDIGLNARARFLKSQRFFFWRLLGYWCLHKGRERLAAKSFRNSCAQMSFQRAASFAKY